MSDSQNDIIASIQEMANSPSSEVSEITKRVSSKGSKNSSLFDNIKSLLTKKNLYMICGVIVLGVVAYYFLYKKKDKSSDKSDVVISLPNENVDNNEIELDEIEKKIDNEFKKDQLVSKKITDKEEKTKRIIEKQK